ncbi:PEP/pyruvate-binding domain-containing protein [Pseudobacteroides cellulosolvens]|uniref:Pyruvate, water dikinase n=1 Tax=Pseudobacteroides cellulosolvens ATCC 35603 = DSM 2933 TaxID=398512 RepID=A0A0L6JQ17_9FIRM|nr:PEP/pyruvate-binding domain-containing protein [Pseudobacteroides cellulosolvens]KNY27878.1 Pyruvate, water dikinase [Pseudobacteroides cellulosolvens ATCC 35603 = DSM 2933]
MLVSLSSYAKADKVGNKAQSLMKLRNNGFCVPDGFVLDSDTYDEVIRESGLAGKINELSSKINKDNIRTISSEIIKLFDKIDLTHDVISEISKLLQIKKYAVRSSGLKEDLAGFAFAGQYRTFLNVEGIDDICKSIIGCYKSMYTEGVLSYLIDNGLGVSDMKMAVVVQEMVEADISGIAFTVNPLSGNDKEIVVEVAEGLGEEIVSGKVNPECYLYNWFDDKEVYEKTNKLLTREKFLKLAKKALDIQMLYGFPCDIEFAVKDNEIYFVQARAITKIMYSGIKDQWTTADFKDGGVSANVCTPYMWSLYEFIWEYTLKKFVFDSKILNKSEWRKAGDMFFGRPYWNLSVVKTAMSKVPGYKEREFDNDLGVMPTYEGDGNVTKITPKTLLGILRMAIAQKKIVADRSKNAQKLKTELLDKYFNYINSFKNEEKLDDLEFIWYKLVKEDYLLSESTYFWQIFINTVNQSLFKDNLLKFVSSGEYFNLIGGLDNISHLLPFYYMWDISRKIIADKKAYAFWSDSKVSVIKKAYDENSNENYIPKLAEFINLYGYHSEKELDVTYPCYCEDVESVIKMFKETVALDDSLSPESDRKHQVEVFEKQKQKLKEQLGKKKYLKVEKSIVKMRSMLWWREEFRDISTRFYYIIRIFTMKLSKAYVKSGILSCEDDIWYTKIEDVFEFIDRKITQEDLRNIIARNRKYYQSFQNFLSENEIGAAFNIASIKGKKMSGGIKGIGCNNGTVTGPARVINSLAEIDRLQVGDILVTRFTDTGWTSKFAILKGIVTEYGGILCHAAIVSREYGIPCVVCTNDATKLIKDGSTITINGTTGEITVEKE